MSQGSDLFADERKKMQHNMGTQSDRCWSLSATETDEGPAKGSGGVGARGESL